ncbi:MAG: nucleotidyltransferase family protein [Methanobacterium sp.]
MDDATERKIKYLVESDLNWNYLLKIASKHGLKPLLYWHLSRIYSDRIPFEFINNLKEFLKNNANKNLFFLKEIVEVVKLLNEHAIESVPYKGPILAQEVYGNLSMRQFGDLDLFVKKDDVPKAKEILISKGYKPEFSLDSVQEQNYINSQRELKFSHELKGISLELHWKFSGIFLNLPSNAEKIFLNDLNSLNIGGVSIPEISPENLILILSIHNASHQWSRLAWLVDIVILVNKKEIDWALVLSIAEQLSIQRILFINLYLCQVLLNIELDDKVSRFLKNESMEKASNMFAARFFVPESENSLIENMQISLNIRENKKDGVKDCLSGIFYPSFYELNHLTLPSHLFFLYYIYRPLNLLNRYKLYK